MRITVSVAGRFHAFDLARELETRGYLARLITSYPKFAATRYGIPRKKIRSIIAKEIIQRGWKELPGFLRNRYNPAILNAFFDRLAARGVGDCDLCVAWSGSALRTLRAAHARGAKTILERGSSHILYQRDILKEEYERLGIRGVLPHPRVVETELQEYEEAGYISVPSLFVKRTFLDRGISESKIIHVPYGVDLTAFRKTPKEDNVFRVVFAGGMTVRKGVHYLLRAWAELNLPGAELLLIGTMNDEMKPFFKKYKGTYRYAGHVPQGELYRYYSQGSLFVMCSIEEGLALVMPQAMACGLPVIATVNTGAEDIVRDGEDGFVIPIRNIEILKEKILYLYKNPDVVHAMGRAAEERVRTGFTWSDYGDRITREYLRVLSD